MQVPSMTGERYMTAAEAAAYLKICRERIYRLAQNAQLPAVRIGRQWRFCDKPQQ